MAGWEVGAHVDQCSMLRLFDLVLQLVEEGGPSDISDSSTEITIPDHVGDSKGFDTDNVAFVNDGPSGLVLPVVTTVGNALVYACYLLAGFVVVTGTFLTT